MMMMMPRKAKREYNKYQTKQPRAADKHANEVQRKEYMQRQKTKLL